VRNEVISIWLFDFKVFNYPFLTKLLFGKSDGVLYVVDIVISTEVWDKIVTIWRIRFVLNSPVMSELLLSQCDIISRVKHIVISSEMRYRVVHIKFGFRCSWSPCEEWLSIQLDGAGLRNKGQHSDANLLVH